MNEKETLRVSQGEFLRRDPAAGTAETPDIAPPIVVPPVPAMRVITLSVVALTAGIGLTSWFARFGDVSLTGYLRAEHVTVFAPRSGRIESLIAKSGEAIKPRQPLLQLADESLDHELAAKAREVRSLEASLEQCRARADVQISLQLKTLEEELLRTRLDSAEYLNEQFAARLEHATWRNFSKEANTGRWLAVATDGMHDPANVFNALVTDQPFTPEEVRLRAVMRQEMALNSAEVKKAKADLCDHHVRDLESLRQTLPEKIRKAAGVDVAEANLDLATEKLHVLNQQKTALAVAAPGHGVVGTYARQAGDPVTAGEPLVTVLDRDRPYIEVDVPSRQVHLLEVGKIVPLQFAAAGRTGRVEAISPQAHRPDGSNDSNVTVRIRPAGRLWPDVPIGSAVSVKLK